MKTTHNPIFVLVFLASLFISLFSIGYTQVAVDVGGGNATPPPHCPGSYLRVERNGTGGNWTAPRGLYINRIGIGGSKEDWTANIVDVGNNHIEFNLPTYGPYGATYIVIDRPGGSPAFSNADSVLITFDNNDAGTLSYNSNNPICMSSSTEMPTIDGGWGSCTNCPISGLSIVAGTGVIDPSASTGNFTYQVIAQSGGNCPVACTTNVTIDTIPSAAFTYNTIQFCEATDPPYTPPAPAEPGGTFTASPLFGLTLNGSNGTVTPGTSTPNTYDITYTTPNINSCGTQSSTQNNLINIEKDWDPSFTMPGGPSYTFCQQDCSIVATANTPGDVSVFTRRVVSGGPTLLFYPTSRRIVFNGSDPGVYEIITISNGTNCVEQDTLQFTIIGTPVPTFNYTPDTVCGNSSTPVSPGGGFTPGGTWSFTLLSGPGPNLGIRPNGEIVPDSSDEGEYQVTYSVGGSCLQTDTDIIRITRDRDSGFLPPSFSYCPFDPAFNINPDTPSDWADWGILPATSGFDSTNVTAVFDPGVTGPGSFTVTMTTRGGGCAETNSHVIVVNPLDDPFFDFTDTAFCVYDAPIPPNTINDPVNAKNFQYNLVSGTGPLDLDSLTGTVDFSNSGPGVYQVYHTSIGTCPQFDDDTIRVWRQEQPDFSFSRVFFCISEGVQLPDVLPGDPGGFFSDSVLTGGAVYIDFDSTTGGIRPDTSDPGIYLLRYTTTGPCPEVGTDTIRIRAMDTAIFDYPLSAYCQGLDTIDNVTMPNPGGYTPLFTNQSAGNLALNSTNGHVNLLNSDEDSTFVVQLEWTDAFCPVNQTDTFTIIKPDSGSIDYGFSILCEDTVSASGPVPSSYGPPGGFFFMEPLPDTDPRTITVDSMTGEIVPVGGDTGRYQVFYTPPGTCVELDSQEVRFDTVPDASFTYTSSVFCRSDPPETPTRIEPSGNFSVSPPSGLSFNTTTGEILPGFSQAGVYVIKHTVNANCPIADSLPITIIDPGSAAFSYDDTTLCTGGINPLPRRQGQAPNGIFTSVPTGLTFIDHPDSSSTGQIDLSNTPATSYTIYYTTPGCAVTDSFDINVLPGDPADFEYDNYEYCVTGLDSAEIFNVTTPGGTFSELSGTLNPDPSSGKIMLNPSLAGGPYVISYTTNGTCPTTDTSHILVSGPAPATFYYPQGTQYCTNDSNPIPIITGQGGGYFTGSFGVFFADSAFSSTGEINMQATAPGSYTITYSPSAACANTATFNLVVTDTTRPILDYMNGLHCQGSGTLGPTLPATVSGTFTEMTGGLVVDPNTGVVDLNNSMPGGPYRIDYQATGNCMLPASDTIVITPVDSANFSYPTTTWCTTFPPQIPSVTGTGSGTFSYRDPVGNDFLDLDPITGTIDPSTSGLDFFWVRYTTSGSCPAIDSVLIGNFRAVDAESYWPSVILCTADSIAVADSAFPATGAWTADPYVQNFWADSLAGIINLRTIPPGTYQITYFDTSASVCPTSDTDTLQIELSDTASIYYRDSITTVETHFCPIQSQDPGPVIIGTQGGTFSSLSNGIRFRPGGDLSGVLDVSECQPQTAPYVIEYNTGGDCGTVATDLVWIDPVDSASINYDDAEYCKTDGNPTPTLSGVTGGTFYDILDTTGRLVFADTLGTIDLLTSVSGLYTIGYTVQSGCAAVATDVVEILSNPAPDLVYDEGGGFVDDDKEICFGEPMFFRASGVSVGTDFFTFLLGDSIVRPRQFTGLANQWDSDSLPPGLNRVIVVLESAESGCPASDTILVRVFETPAGEIEEMPTTVSSGEPVFFYIKSLTDNTSFTWIMRGIGDVIPDNISDQTLPMLAGARQSITRPTPELGNELDPARLSYTFTPRANGCVGEDLIGSILVKPDEFEFFIPGVITPNGNGQNDYWEIKWGGEFQPDEFYIEVYNRSGGLVYVLEALDEQWDARNLADGNYMYILKSREDDSVRQRGMLRIKRD